MLGAWAGALLAIAALTRLAYRGFVKGITVIFREEVARVWKDMSDIEDRLSKLELSLTFLREQIADLRLMMQTHIEEP